MGDTTIYNPSPTTAHLDDGEAYYKKNKKYIDWDPKDKRMVVIGCVVEKDSTTSYIRIKRSSGVDKLDEEAIRLIENAKITPGKNDEGKVVRSTWVTVINFPETF